VSKYFTKVFSDAKVFDQQSFSDATDYKYYAPQFTERHIQHCMPLALLWSTIMLGTFQGQAFGWKEVLLLLAIMWTMLYPVPQETSGVSAQVKHIWSIRDFMPRSSVNVAR